ncbi:MAG: hypothetical protein COX57_12295 [Alphaproteobacteria bacterium CG_4_10_14_0_2_um_filter_63_37]|nr:MAG: hypothetical protein AUJ55_09785 [Proteobacteria bacterium CG1_02_64_396]PJA23751.1 MAG: hypothetical protein COX57_12295 [Alphaproteobacteria bacterium CG_4_10_14_0_2_um_filter_63_37]
MPSPELQPILSTGSGNLLTWIHRLRFRRAFTGVRATQGPGDVSRFVQQSPGPVLLAGGDGSLREALTAARPDQPVAFFPAGTASVARWDLGYGRTVSGWRHWRTRPMHLGWIEQGGQVCDGFVMMLSAGPDAAAVAGVSKNLKRWSGPLAYLTAMIRALLAPMGAIRVILPDGEERMTPQVIVQKIAHYGGPFPVAPGRSSAGIGFAVLVWRGRGAWSVLLGFIALFLRLPFWRHWVERIDTDGPVRLEAVAGAVAVQIDGDPAPPLPLTVVDGPPRTLAYPVGGA